MSPTPTISNRLLAALAPRDLDALGAHLEPVPLSHKQTLSNPGAPIEHVYFPEIGMVSLVQPLPGGMIEVGMIGNEGFVGVPVLLGADTSPLEAMVQIPGSALRMQAGSAHARKRREPRGAGSASGYRCSPSAPAPAPRSCGATHGNHPGALSGSNW